MTEPGRPRDDSADDTEEGRSEGFDSLAKAAASSPLAKAETSVLDALGGVWGIITSIIPVLVFVVVFTLTEELRTTLIAAVASGVVVLVVSLFARRPISQSIGGLLGVVVCALVARSTGRSEDFFALGLLANAGYALALTVSILIRYPAVGIVVAALKGAAGTPGGFFGWRQDPVTLRRYGLVTWLWVGLFVARLLVQAPLYFAGLTAPLGTAKLVMGLPLTAVVLWMTWLIVRRPARG
ncbi:uncharacterized protein DUF3159 [Brevibacterium sanguinis]|uniref:Uncharacterized protein DUF3159 n=2 Tax=Brevibacterium TaxID=1696 RepID=A0A366IJS3_9MICO|nr:MULTISPECIES: DUF3159 domain-containing protein [Brevibacterium]RBP64001.1 uncharacterized protein DUF3159 [Brevibacterium sanguinis]RBP70724.1 uncharacterized protein DUF3159 [Brevibacterium celere]